MPDTSSKKILVVDDEQDVLTHLTNILKHAHYEIISTTKGKEAVQLAKSELPDLIILDIVLPDMDGGEVAAILSENPSTSNIPIIYLTGILAKEEESLAKKSGKHYVIAKPTTGREVLDKIKDILSSI